MRIKIYVASAYEKIRKRNFPLFSPVKDKRQHEIQAFISKDDKGGLKQKEQLPKKKGKKTEKYKCTRLVM